MRKLCFALSLLLCGATTSLLQGQSDLKFGAKLGLNLARMNYYERSDTRPALYIGVIIEKPLSEKLAIAPELMFSMQGNMRSYGKETGITRTINLNIPIRAKYYIIDRLSISVDPQIDFYLGGNRIFKYDTQTHKESIKEYNVFDFGLNFGAEYTIILNLADELRYNLGLLNLNKSEKIDDRTEKFDSKKTSISNWRKIYIFIPFHRQASIINVRCWCCSKCRNKDENKNEVGDEVRRNAFRNYYNNLLL